MKGSTSQDDDVYFLTRSTSSSGQQYIQINESKINASSSKWFTSAGAYSHMTPRLSSISKLQYTKWFSVGIGNSSAVTVEGRSDVDLFFNGRGIQTECLIQDILYVPGLQFGKGASMSNDGKLYAGGKALADMYVFDTWQQKPKISMVRVASINTRHER